MASYSSFQRHRSRTVGSFTPTSPGRQAFTRSLNSSCQGTWSASGPVSYGTEGTVTTKTIWDCKTPRFQTLRKLGFVNPLPVYIDTVTETRKSAPFVHERGPLTGTCAGVAWSTFSSGPSWPVIPVSLSLPGWNNTLLTAAVNGAVAEARQASWDVLTDIAELRETIKLFRAGIAVGNQAVSKIASKALRYASRPKQFAKAVADGWLTYRYGVMPTVYSLQDAVKALQQAERKYAIGRSRTSESDVLVKDTDLSNSQVYAIAGETLSFTRDYRGHSMAAFDKHLSDSYRFDPVTTAYELVTLSFVLDWFIDVGTWLEAVSPFSAGSTRFVFGSVKTKSLYTQVRRQDARNTSTDFGRGSLLCEVIKIERETYERFPTTTSLPGWNPRLNLPRIADAISLAGGLRSRARSTLRI